MVTKKSFIKRILIIIEKHLEECLPESGTLEEMYECVRIIFRRRLYLIRRR